MKIDPAAILADFDNREMLTRVLNIADPETPVDITMHAMIDVCMDMTENRDNAAAYGGLLTGMIMHLGQCEGAAELIAKLRAQVQEAARNDGR